MRNSEDARLIGAGIVLAILLAVSGWRPYDRATWLMEVAPVLVAVPVLIYTRRRFPLTPLLYGLVFAHAVILIVGGAYTYARVPAGFWVKDLLHLGRNPYDKLGHFAQGFIPAIVTREVLIRNGYIVRGKMAGFLSVSVAMAISAWYELIEWWAALALGQGADEFLGTQGDPWDTQSDMFCAFLGATAALLLLSRIHDRQMGQLEIGREVASPRVSAN